MEFLPVGLIIRPQFAVERIVHPRVLVGTSWVGTPPVHVHLGTQRTFLFHVFPDTLGTIFAESAFVGMTRLSGGMSKDTSNSVALACQVMRTQRNLLGNDFVKKVAGVAFHASHRGNVRGRGPPPILTDDGFFMFAFHLFSVRGLLYIPCGQGGFEIERGQVHPHVFLATHPRFLWIQRVRGRGRWQRWPRTMVLSTGLRAITWVPTTTRLASLPMFLPTLVSRTTIWRLASLPMFLSTLVSGIVSMHDRSVQKISARSLLFVYLLALTRTLTVRTFLVPMVTTFTSFRVTLMERFSF